MESGIGVGDAHWEYDSSYFTCCMFKEKQWENHDFHTTSLFFMWEEPFGEFEFLEEALHG